MAIKPQVGNRVNVSGETSERKIRVIELTVEPEMIDSDTTEVLLIVNGKTVKRMVPFSAERMGIIKTSTW